MTKITFFLIALIFSVVSVGQSFEGKIVYSNSYKSKTTNVTDEQFTSMLGSTMDYYIKDGGYKAIVNGSLIQWQIYVNKDNKLYTKMANSDTLIWNDGATNPFEVVKSEINKGVTVILGYKCDELILTCKTGIQKYYFNTKFSVDPKLFVNHKFGNWFDFVAKSKSLPLKSIIEVDQFSIESIAIEIVPMNLEKTFFELPPNSVTKKSAY